MSIKLNQTNKRINQTSIRLNQNQIGFGSKFYQNGNSDELQLQLPHVHYSFICQAAWKYNSTDTNQKSMHTDLYIEIWTSTKGVLGSDAFNCKKKEQMTLGETWVQMLGD